MDPRSSDTKAGESKTSESWLRHPTVIAAIVAGIFGLVTIILKPEYWRAWWEFLRAASEQSTAPASRSALHLGPVSARLGEIRRTLASRVDGKPDIDARMRALTELVTISGEQPPEAYFKQAAEMLAGYVKDNIDERRAPGPRVEVDPRPPGVFRPADIIIAIEGLQAVRRASQGRVEASLAGVDFHRINLSDLDFEQFDFSHADFSHAFLSNCRCRGASFAHAKFIGTAIWGTHERPAEFRDVRFDGADLTGSKWANVDFSGSNIEKATGHAQRGLLADARGLTPEQRALFR
jgi:hypothetical protein